MRTNAGDPAHVSVLLTEVLSQIAPAPQQIFVDGTFGAGGYSRALLESADCTVIGIDRDPTAVATGRDMEAAYSGRFHMVAGRFSQMDALVAAAGWDAVDGIALDIGVSSMQIDEADRGFSFQADGPLDMRMSRVGETAADVINSRSEEEIANIIFNYGDERQSRRIARAIVSTRMETPFTRTLELARLIEKTIGRPRPKKGRKFTHPATKSFQALRIFVNDELGELDAGLRAAERLLKPGGRLCVVAFHSLEDRMVKTFLTTRAGALPSGSRHLPEIKSDAPAPTFRLMKKSAIKPTDAEAAQNPRARSARLRVGIRTEAAPWLEGMAA